MLLSKHGTPLVLQLWELQHASQAIHWGQLGSHYGTLTIWYPSTHSLGIWVPSTRLWDSGLSRALGNSPGGYCPGLKVHISPYTYPGLALSCATASEVRTTLCTPVESMHTCSPTVAQISAFISCVEWPTCMQVPGREAREVSVVRSSPAADCRSNCPGLSSVLERDQAGGSDS